MRCGNRFMNEMKAVVQLSGMCVFICLLLAGCSQRRQYQPETDPLSLDDMQFVHFLVGLPTVTFSETCRAITLTADGADEFQTHEERYEELVRRDVVRRAWGLGPDDVVDRGTLAFMSCRVCQLPASVSSTLLGSWGLGDRRYALKQAAYHEIITYGPTYEAVTGGELVNVLAHMDEHLAREGRYDFGKDVDSPADFIEGN